MEIPPAWTAQAPFKFHCQTPTPTMASNVPTKRLHPDYLEDAPEGDEPPEIVHTHPAKRRWAEPVNRPITKQTKINREFVSLRDIGPNQRVYRDETNNPSSVALPRTNFEPELPAIVDDFFKQFNPQPKEQAEEGKKARLRSLLLRDRIAESLCTRKVTLGPDGKVQEMREFTKTSKRDGKLYEKIETIKVPPKSEHEVLAVLRLKEAEDIDDSMVGFTFGDSIDSRPIHEQDSEGCSFCMFHCDYGVSDARVWLPLEASRGYCVDCHLTTVGAVTELDLTVASNSKYARSPQVIDAFYAVYCDEKSKVETPLKELGDTTNFRDKARKFTATPVVKDFEKQMQDLFKAMVATRSGKQHTMMSSPAAVAKALADAFRGMSMPQLEQMTQIAAIKMMDSSRDVGNSAMAKKWKELSTLLGPEQLLFAMRRLNSSGRALMSPLVQQGKITAPTLPPMPGPSTTSHQPSFLPSPSSSPPLPVNTSLPGTGKSPAVSSVPSITQPGVAKPNFLPSPTSSPPAPASTPLPGAVANPAKPTPSQALPAPQQTLPTTISRPMGPPPRPESQRTKSTGMNLSLAAGIMRYPGVDFCRGSPYRQLDIKKARICKDCRDEKLSIATHIHRNFKGGFDGKRTCMVCTQPATSGCQGCPLIVCDGCEVSLRLLCKGRVGDLIKSMGERAHVRNDAFLLRGDGHGY